MIFVNVFASIVTGDDDDDDVDELLRDFTGDRGGVVFFFCTFIV